MLQQWPFHKGSNANYSRQSQAVANGKMGLIVEQAESQSLRLVGIPVLGRNAAEAEGGRPSRRSPDRDCCMGSPVLFTR